jgi:hypothetical protein
MKDLEESDPDQMEELLANLPDVTERSHYMELSSNNSNCITA